MALKTCLLRRTATSLLETSRFRFIATGTRSEALSKPENTYKKLKVTDSIDEQALKRISKGLSANAITAAKGGKEFRRYRCKILDCNSIEAIHAIIKSKSNFDVKVYTAAIKRAGMLRNVFYCKILMKLALKKNKLQPDLTLYNTLFHAFNLNHTPFYCDSYYQEMVDVYRLQPDIIMATALLGGCTKHGDAQRIDKIWNEVIIKYNFKIIIRCVVSNNES